MRKLYFLGGEDLEKRESKKINQKALVDAGGAPRILIFPWTSETTEKEDRYRKIMEDYFKDIGARKIEFAEVSDSFQKITRKINSSDLIYLPGGNPKILVQRAKNKNVDSLLQKYNKPIIGNSAGALALCKNYVVIKGQEDKLKSTLVPGFGLVDFAVSVHYKSSNTIYSGQSPDDALKDLSEQMKIYAISERGALIYDNGCLKFIGNIYLFYHGKKTKCK